MKGRDGCQRERQVALVSRQLIVSPVTSLGLSGDTEPTPCSQPLPQFSSLPCIFRPWSLSLGSLQTLSWIKILCLNIVTFATVNQHTAFPSGDYRWLSWSWVDMPLHQHFPRTPDQDVECRGINRGFNNMVPKWEKVPAFGICHWK